MEDLIKESIQWLLYPYRFIENMLGLDIDPLILAYVIAAVLTALSLLLWILRFRRLSRLIGLLALLSIVPPLLLTIYSFLSLLQLIL